MVTIYSYELMILVQVVLCGFDESQLRFQLISEFNNSLMYCRRSQVNNLRAFATDAACQLDVFWHDGNTLGVDGAQVGVFEKTNKVGFGCFLKCKNSGTLESKVGFEVLGDFTYQSLEWKLADQKIGRFLVSADLTKGNSSRPVSVWFLYTASGWGRFAGSFGCQLLAWSFATGGLASCLFGAGHDNT